MGISISNLDAIAWHLEQGHDNGKIEKIPLAKFLRSVAKELTAADELARAAKRQIGNHADDCNVRKGFACNCGNKELFAALEKFKQGRG